MLHEKMLGGLNRIIEYRMKASLPRTSFQAEMLLILSPHFPANLGLDACMNVCGSLRGSQVRGIVGAARNRAGLPFCWNLAGIVETFFLSGEEARMSD